MARLLLSLLTGHTLVLIKSITNKVSSVIRRFSLHWHLVNRFELELGAVAHVLNHLTWQVELLDPKFDLLLLTLLSDFSCAILRMTPNDFFYIPALHLLPA